MLSDDWHVPPRFESVEHDDGRHLVYDPSTQRSWTVSPATAALIRALRDGWRPGAPTPAQLHAYVGALSPAEWGAVRDALGLDGLLGPHQAGGTPPVLARNGRWDVRVRIGYVRPVGAGVVRALAFAAAAVAIGAIAVIADAGTGRAAKRVYGLWTEYHARTPGSLMFGILVLTQIASATAHEIAHALVLAAKSQRRVEAGVRVQYGYPSAYTDASSVLALPHRADRIAVLLAGVAVDATAWLAACAAVVTWGVDSGGSLLALATFGPLTLAAQLLPVFSNDGYYVLADLARAPNLMADARDAVRTFWTGETPGRAWLPWYGLAELGFGAAAIVAVALGAGVMVGAEAAAAVAGACAATLYLVRARVRAARPSHPPTDTSHASP